MAKKKTVRKVSPPRPADADPQVQSAADALRAAREELRRVEEQYQKVRQQAAEKIEQVRDTTVGDMLDGALEIVRQHPGPSLLAAVAFGIMLDHWLRRK